MENILTKHELNIIKEAMIDHYHLAKGDGDKFRMNEVLFIERKINIMLKEGE